MAIVKTGVEATYSAQPTGFDPIVRNLRSQLDALATCIASANADHPELRANIDRCRAELATMWSAVHQNDSSAY